MRVFAHDPLGDSELKHRLRGVIRIPTNEVSRRQGFCFRLPDRTSTTSIPFINTNPRQEIVHPGNPHFSKSNFPPTFIPDHKNHAQSWSFPWLSISWHQDPCSLDQAKPLDTVLSITLFWGMDYYYSLPLPLNWSQRSTYGPCLCQSNYRQLLRMHYVSMTTTPIGK